MAFDAEEVAVRARERITERSETDLGYTVPRLMVFIPDALKELGEMYSSSDDFRLLQAEFKGVPDNGRLDIFTMLPLDPVNHPQRIIFSSIERRPQFRETFDHQQAVPVKFIRIPRRGAFYSRTTTATAGVVFYFIEGDNVIAFKGPNNKLPGHEDAYSVSITMTANVVPTLEIVEAKPVLKTPLIDLVAAIALRSVRGNKDLTKVPVQSEGS